MTENKRYEFNVMNGGGYVVGYSERMNDDISFFTRLCEVPTKRQAEKVCNELKGLQKENEQLKQYIYDNLDEDICDVCNYQYLEKSKMDKYYVAKCKKGYDNCSKGTVIHCKDFKFKELQE